MKAHKRYDLWCFYDRIGILRDEINNICFKSFKLQEQGANTIIHVPHCASIEDGRFKQRNEHVFNYM